MRKNGLRILVVDDDDVDRRQLGRLLRKAMADVSVVEAEDLEQAVALVTAERIDCALLDYRLPGLDGLEGLEQLRAAAPDVVVIMVTGYGDPTTAVSALHEGAQDYLPKDRLDVHTLLQAVQHAIERDALQRQVEQQREALISFSRTLAHDLNAPLRRIQMFVELMSGHLHEGDEARVAEAMQRVVTNATQARAIIDRLYEYTQPDAEIRFESDVALDDVLSEVVAVLEADIARRGARLHRTPLPRITASVPELRLVFQNLISNGLKYSDADTPQIWVRAEAWGGTPCIEIADNGIGIPAAQCAAVFEPLRRLHGRDQYGGGVGLGLSICRKVVERHGGRIWCELRPGGGTRFLFTLAPSAEQAPAPARSRAR